ncbi:co-chaperone protein HscB homolog [Eurosta solidaginis]|uniref:co-chaperone protein HscB homolog n=1 Tax=Eurosta solidaginis TaxID=178769 RepID=UPI0035307BA4
MRRFAGSLHTIRLQLSNSDDCARLPSLANFCLLPNVTGEIKHVKITSAIKTKADAGTLRQVVAQQIRKYAPPSETTTAESACWNCTRNGRKNHLICTSCGYLQDVNEEVNYFELFNLPSSFSLEQQELTRRFRQLQTLVHPDKFSNKTTREQKNSADWSALINKAYKTLSAPIERGQYILKLQGQQMPQDNSALDKAFLMDMMERNEQVEEANTSKDLELLNDAVVQELNASTIELNKKFELKALEEAKNVLVKMKYLLSVQKSIKSKLQTLMGG